MGTHVLHDLISAGAPASRTEPATLIARAQSQLGPTLQADSARSAVENSSSASSRCTALPDTRQTQRKRCLRWAFVSA